jgi:GxxExxY protein
MNSTDQDNKLTEVIIGAAINVHKELGPGLLESAYEACLVNDLQERGLKVEQQKPIPLIYKNVKLDCGYRLDLLVEDRIIVEIKTVEAIAPVHKAQILSYLHLTGLRTGLLINFHVALLKDGIKRYINTPSF